MPNDSREASGTTLVKSLVWHRGNPSRDSRIDLRVEGRRKNGELGGPVAVPSRPLSQTSKPEQVRNVVRWDSFSEVGWSETKRATPRLDLLEIRGKGDFKPLRLKLRLRL